jgi:hypothetical protein
MASDLLINVWMVAGVKENRSQSGRIGETFEAAETTRSWLNPWFAPNMRIFLATD